MTEDAVIADMDLSPEVTFLNTLIHADFRNSYINFEFSIVAEHLHTCFDDQWCLWHNATPKHKVGPNRFNVERDGSLLSKDDEDDDDKDRLG